MTEKHLHMLKPRIMVAIFPHLFRNLLYSLPVVLGIIGVYFLVKKPLGMTYPIGLVIAVACFVLFVIAIMPLFATIFRMHFTKYYFYRTHLVKQVKIITVRKQSVPYHQIVNITTRISVWGRIWNTGDIIVHTVEENIEDIVLEYIKDPNKIETSIYQMVHESKGKGHR